MHFSNEPLIAFLQQSGYVKLRINTPKWCGKYQRVLCKHCGINSNARENSWKNLYTWTSSTRASIYELPSLFHHYGFLATEWFLLPREEKYVKHCGDDYL